MLQRIAFAGGNLPQTHAYGFGCDQSYEQGADGIIEHHVGENLARSTPELVHSGLHEIAAQEGIKHLREGATGAIGFSLRIELRMQESGHAEAGSSSAFERCLVLCKESGKSG